MEPRARNCLRALAMLFLTAALYSRQRIDPLLHMCAQGNFYSDHEPGFFQVCLLIQGHIIIIQLKLE